jgi:capsular exopolysaccharide synthesis family protein
LFGIMAAIGVALLRSSRGLLVTSAAALETFSGITVFASIPDFRSGRTKSKGAKNKLYLPVRDSPDSPCAHAYRALRAAIKFAQKGRPLRTMTITSSVQGEGKSTTTLDLALSLVKSGSKVLVVDADIRRPVVHKFLELDRSPGLAEVLDENLPITEAIRSTDIENLSVLTCGKAHNHPGELLALPAMVEVVAHAGEEYDYALFDVPPVLAVADASGFLAELDGIFMLTRANAVPGAVIESAAGRLRLSGGTLVGAILNGVRTSRFSGYGRGYGKGYGYGYSYGYSSSYKYTDSESRNRKKGNGDK